MTVYAIGDVQGCYKSLRLLLNKVNFDNGVDELWFAGDLVNRGPESANVLRFVKSLRNVRVVLGNHDLHLLAVAGGFRTIKPSDTYNNVLNAHDREELLTWLRGQSLAHFDRNRNILLVHAGLFPDWSLAQGLQYANEVEAMIRSDKTFPSLLRRMYGNQPCGWTDEGDKFDRARVIINAFTRMRFLSKSGEMDFSMAGAPGTQSEGFLPWYQMRRFDGFRVIFGHWSMLGAHDFKDVLSLDSGCVHGGLLSAIDIDATETGFTQVPCVDYRPSIA